MCCQFEPDSDPEMELLYQEDQRRIHAPGQEMFDCPDCGAKQAITAEMKHRGYHCDSCTRIAEQGL